MVKVFISFFIMIITVQLNAQTNPATTPAKDEKPAPKEDKNLPNIVFNPDQKVVTDHTTTIKGQRIAYKAKSLQYS